MIAAAAAAKERVRLAAATLEKERATAEALELAAAATQSRTAPPKTSPSANTETYADDDTYLEAVTIANLHTQASAV